MPLDATKDVGTTEGMAIVYTWTSPDVEREVSSHSRSLPAIRVWGDSLLEYSANRLGIALDPPITERRNAVFAWLTGRPPSRLSVLGSPKIVRRLLVDSEECAVARIDHVDRLYQPPEWRQLKAWLLELGYEEEHIEEELVAVDEPMLPLSVGTSNVVAELTQPALMADVATFFHPSIIQYLRSWKRLTGVTAENVGDGEWEVIVPENAILEYLD